MIGKTQNSNASPEALRQMALAGDPEAAFELGWDCLQGHDGPRNDEEAASWYRLASISSPEAENNLGWMYQNGCGVPQDDAEALRLYRRAADGGCPTAFTNLGWMYLFGRGVSRDVTHAEELFRKAEKNGCPAASVWMAHICREHMTGKGMNHLPENASRDSRLSESSKIPSAILVALNYCRVSISRITATGYKAILDQEYNDILDNIDPAVLSGDNDLLGLFDAMLELFSADLLRSEESAHFLAIRNRRMATRLSEALKETRVRGMSFGSSIISASFSALGTYLRYRFLPEKYERDLDEANWTIQHEHMKEYAALRRKFFRTSAMLVTRYGLPSRTLLAEEQIKTFQALLADDDAEKHLRLSAYFENDFSAFPPYWLRRGLLARQTGEADMALKCFDRVAMSHCGVLRKDPFFASALLASVDLLPEGQQQEKIRRLHEAECCFRREEWMPRFLIGVHSYLLGDVDFGTGCVRHNIDSGIFPEMHERVLQGLERNEVDFTTAKEMVEAISECVEREMKSGGSSKDLEHFTGEADVKNGLFRRFFKAK